MSDCEGCEMARDIARSMAKRAEDGYAEIQRLKTEFAASEARVKALHDAVFIAYMDAADIVDPGKNLIYTGGFDPEPIQRMLMDQIKQRASRICFDGISLIEPTEIEKDQATKEQK